MQLRNQPNPTTNHHEKKKKIPPQQDPQLFLGFEEKSSTGFFPWNIQQFLLLGDITLVYAAEKYKDISSLLLHWQVFSWPLYFQCLFSKGEGRAFVISNTLNFLLT